MDNKWIVCSFLCLYIYASSASSEIIKLSSASRQAIEAEYLSGTNNGSPVLLLHGFLQTNKFSTVSRLAATLHESGYSVLNPTLSLGISNRKQSLACEAIHTHSLDTEADELGQWIQWLHKKTKKPVILIGHSAGGPVILKYMQDNNAKYIKHSVLISLSYYASGPTANETEAHAEMARAALNNDTNPIGTYALNYCKTYPTYARSFLSYYQWDRDRVSDAVGQFENRISVIIGGEDKRIDGDWHQKLKSIYSNITVIDGANHFFDQAYEFELTDTVEEILAQKIM